MAKAVSEPNSGIEAKTMVGDVYEVRQESNAAILRCHKLAEAALRWAETPNDCFVVRLAVSPAGMIIVHTYTPEECRTELRKALGHSQPSQAA